MELEIQEALRYLGVRGEPEPELRRRVEETAAELEGRVAPRYVYRVFDLERTGEGFALPGTGVVLAGALAERMLGQCHRAALMACTLGAGFDRMLTGAQARDMAGAVVLDACGGALVEAGCDRAQEELASRLAGDYLTDRFSPGYGDLSLELQREICRALEADKRLGLFVTQSCMLVPVKSVTAVVGVAHTPQPARVRGCEYCAMRETCALQRRGERCEG